MENEYFEEYSKMEMECETQKSFRRGYPFRKKTGILMILGTVCMIIFLIMTSVIYSHQERNFSIQESWMKSHTSELTSEGNVLQKKVAELHMLVSNLSSHRNTSEAQEQKLSTIETLITDLGSSLSSLATKQGENQQKLENQQDMSKTELKSLINRLSGSLSAIRSSLRSFSNSRQFNPFSITILDDDLKSSVGELKTLVKALSYKLSFANVLASGCSQPDWIPFSNSCYLFSQNNMNWTDAKQYCEEQGALLVKIEDGSKKEWQFVSKFNNLYTYWVGLTDRDTGVWRWTDDTPYTMNKAQWLPGQPDNWTEHGLGEEDEDCAEITIYGVLNDIHCSSKMKYICEMNNPKMVS